MPKSRNRSGVPGNADLAELSDADLQLEADRVRVRLGGPLSPILQKLFLKKQHALERERTRRAS